MSEPVSALNGASFEGLVTLTDRGPTGMITLRGDLAAPEMAKALDKAMVIEGVRLLTKTGGKSGNWTAPE